jgi:arylsulfatase A-like enzyme
MIGAAASMPMLMSGQIAQAYQKKTPNIVLIIADDASLGDFGCYGHPHIKTPNVDQMAIDGVRFKHAFVTSPQCSPSRTSIWTGKYAHSMGTEDLHTPLPKNQIIVSELLRQKGYYCGNAGKFHLGKNAEHKLDFLNNDIESWLKFMDIRPKDKPFFLVQGFYDPHRPYEKGAIDSPHKRKDVLVSPDLPDTDEVRDDIALYYDEISRMDAEIGKLLKRITQEGLEENTVIFFCSDNGAPFPRAKGTLYDAGIATPLIVRWKGHFKPGVRDGLASLVDITPTILALANIEPPRDIHGRSMIAEIVSEKAPGRDYIFTERNWHDIDDHIRSVRDKRFKYIRNYFPREPFSIAADLASSATFQKMRQLRDAGRLNTEQMLISRWPRPHEELYDLEKDPNEFRNLVYDQAYQKILTKLRRELDKWIAETNDVPPEKRQPNTFDYETGEPLQKP